MLAWARRWRLTLSRQQSQRTTRSPSGFQPVSSHNGQDMSVQMAAKAVGLPRRAVGARLNFVERLVEIGILVVQAVEDDRNGGGQTIEHRRGEHRRGKRLRV